VIANQSGGMTLVSILPTRRFVCGGGRRGWSAGHSRPLQCELLWFRDQKESNRIDDIGQDIDISHPEYDGARYLGGPGDADLVGPFIQYLIDKVDDKGNADEEYGASEKVAVVMGDHEIDLVYAEEHNNKGGEKPEVRAEAYDLPEYNILRQPAQRTEGPDAVEDPLALFGGMPDIKLPDDERKFQQDVDIAGYGIGMRNPPDDDEADDLGEETCQDKDKKGLIHPVYATQTYQPGNNR
jgi:hypothetical protein